MDSINAVEDDSLLDESTYLTKVKNTQIIDAISTKKQLGTCGVCGEDGDGFFFGALVCLPCKSFYVRTLNEDPSIMRCSKKTNSCVITGANRSSCKFCRFNKCLQIGMVRKIRPEVVQAAANQELCAVCQDISNGVHFGALTCEGCKKFFRRSLKESSRYVCRYNKDCAINPRTRNDCRFCRFQKCLSKGMSKDVKIGRPKKEVVLNLTNQSRSNWPAGIAEKSESNPLFTTKETVQSYDSNPDSLHTESDHLIVSQTPALDGNYLIHEEINQPCIDRKLNSNDNSVGNDNGYRGYRNWAVDHQSQYNYVDAFSDRVPSDTNYEGGFIQEPSILKATVKGGFDTRQTSCSISSDEQGISGTMPELSKHKTTASHSQFDTLNLLALRDEPLTAPSMMSRGHHGDLKVAKHKLSDKENGCSCHKLRRLAIENMNVPLPMKTMLIQKIESDGRTPTTVSGLRMLSGAAGMMRMMSEVPGINSTQELKPALIQESVSNQTNDLSTMRNSADISGKSFHNPMNMLSMLEKFKNIKCPFCSRGTDTSDKFTETLSHSKASAVAQPNSDAVCLVHFQESVSTPMTFSHIPPSSSNCICLKNLQIPHSNETKDKEDSLSFGSDGPKVFSQIHIKPGTLEASNVSQFTTMLENMMDQREGMLASHKHIHPTPEACTQTIDRLRMLLKVFGIQEVQPKPNINFENHVFPPEYWLKPNLPGERIMLDLTNKTLLETVGSAYNHLIMIMHEKVEVQRQQATRPDQFPMDIVRKRTIRNLSHWITFIKAIPDFVNVTPGDQFTIVRLAGMMGIMLATAIHQYDPEQNNFTNFYNFEFHPEHPHYHFRHALLKFGRDIQELGCDFIESSMMNACMAIATDFPQLESKDILEKIRQNLLEAFRSYTTAKYGAPNGRVEEIFSWIPRLRELGLWNYKLSFSTCFSFEEKASAHSSS